MGTFIDEDLAIRAPMQNANARDNREMPRTNKGESGADLIYWDFSSNAVMNCNVLLIQSCAGSKQAKGVSHCSRIRP